MPGKCVNWRRDPIILERLVKVQPLFLMNYSTRQIEQNLGIDQTTVVRDIKRIRTLVRENVTMDLIQNMAECIAKYRETQNMAHKSFLQVPDNSLNKSAYLNTIKSCEDSIAKILGLFIERHEVSGEIGIRRYVGVDPSEV